MSDIQSCFFCTTTHDVSTHLYDVPLCGGCRHMERFQILLLQYLCFLQASLDEICQALGPQSHHAEETSA